MNEVSTLEDFFPNLTIIQVSSALEISFVTFDVWDVSKYETEMVGTL